VGRAHWRLGKISFFLGHTDEALEHYRQARMVQGGLAAASPSEPAYREDLARTCLDQGQLLWTLGRNADAEASTREAIGLWEALPTSPAHQADLATCYLVLGGVARATGRIPECEDLVRRTVQVREQLAREHPDDKGRAYELGLAQFYLGNDLGYAREPVKAAEAYREAVKIFERLDHLAPDQAQYQSALAAASANLAQMISMDHPAEAETRLRQAVAVDERLVRDHPRVIGHHKALAMHLHALGLHYQVLKRGAEALSAYERCVRVREEAIRRVPSDVALRTEFAETYGLSGMHCAGLQREKESEKWLDAACELLEALTREHPKLARPALSLAGTCSNRGMTLRWLGKPAAALPWHDRALMALEAYRARAPEPAEVKQFLHNAHAERAATRSALHHYAEGVADYDRAIELSAEGQGDWLRLQRASGRARVGDHAGALAEVDLLAGKYGADTDILHDLACVASLAAFGAERDMQLTSPQRQERADHCARRAMELLRLAEAKGAFATFEQKWHLIMDDDLWPLRARDDFRHFVYHLWRPKW
jgi:tetratricopeptide (TPR) repeat protein